MDSKMQDIADIGEISRPSIYKYFNSKEEIFSAIIEEIINDITGGIDELKIIAGSDPINAIKIYVKQIMDYMFEEKEKCHFYNQYFMWVATINSNEEVTTLFDRLIKPIMNHSKVLLEIAYEKKLINPKMEIEEIIYSIAVIIDGFGFHSIILSKDELNNSYKTVQKAIYNLIDIHG